MKRTRNFKNNKTDKSKPFKPLLHVDGYEIISTGNINIDTMHYISEELINIGDKGNVIFNNKMSGGDNKRSQTFITVPTKPSRTLIKWKQSIEGILKQKYPNLTPNNMAVLKSMKGCKKQMAHCDYEQDLNFATTSDNNIPLGCLICIMENTTLDIWKKSHRLPVLHSDITDNIKEISRTTICLNVGDMLVFRGDLVHAGSSYTSDNYRVHLFMDSTKIKRNKNRTWFMNNVDYIE